MLKDRISVAGAVAAASTMGGYGVLAVVGFVSGCGQRGPLVLPPEVAAASAPRSADPNAPLPPPAP
ncbi:MAG: lipoprotein, partial [Pseudomonadota bacterium]|nr:lipoprotein [Pseudomonadota bacterium]